MSDMWPEQSTDEYYESKYPKQHSRPIVQQAQDEGKRILDDLMIHHIKSKPKKVSSLDDKLLAMSFKAPTNDQGSHIKLNRSGVDRVKEAFSDDPNWVEYGGMPLAPQIKKQAAEYGLMTGQEWLTRFNNELKHLISRGDGETWMGWACGEVIEAAKRAAGLDATPKVTDLATEDSDTKNSPSNPPKSANGRGINF